MLISKAKYYGMYKSTKWNDPPTPPPGPWNIVFLIIGALTEVLIVKGDSLA